MTDTLQDLQFPIDRAIFGETLECIPPDWSKAQLQARAASRSTLSIHIDALGQSGIALVSDELQARVRELFLLNERFSTGLRGIVYTYSRNSDGRWHFAGDYEYA